MEQHAGYLGPLGPLEQALVDVVALAEEGELRGVASFLRRPSR